MYWGMAQGNIKESKHWALTEELSSMETAEMRFVRVVRTNTTTNHKRNEDIREEMGVTYMSTMLHEISKEMARTFGKKAWKFNTKG